MPLQLGNTKLGKVWHWSIPAGHTCPGQTRLCSEACYAKKGRYHMPNVAGAHASNWEEAKQRSFANWMIQEIRTKRIQLMRVHASGDFDRLAYVKAWIRIANECPDTRFWAYTRSWRVDGLRPGLLEISRLANFRLWLSCDRETGAPPRWSKARRAYMAVSDNDKPRFAVDLVFRVKRDTVMKRLPESGVLVCPVEQGVARNSPITCELCRLCFDDRRSSMLAPTQGRVALPLVLK